MTEERCCWSKPIAEMQKQIEELQKRLAELEARTFSHIHVPYPVYPQQAPWPMWTQVTYGPDTTSSDQVVVEKAEGK